MLGRRSQQPAGAIDLREVSEQLGDAPEVLRVFMPLGDAPPVAGIFVDPPAGLQPFGFGILLADLLHHAAKAYAYKFGIGEDEARYAISQGLSAELNSPTDEVKQVLPDLSS